MNEYVIIIIAYLITIAILSLSDCILRIVFSKGYYKATLNLLLSTVSIISALVVIYWDTGLKLVF